MSLFKKNTDGSVTINMRNFTIAISCFNGSFLNILNVHITVAHKSILYQTSKNF